MAETMIERVARALCDSQETTEENWQSWVHAARAVVREMREPTEVMIPPGGVSAGIVDGLDHYLDRDEARHTWQTMVDAILSEPHQP